MRRFLLIGAGEFVEREYFDEADVCRKGLYDLIDLLKRRLLRERDLLHLGLTLGIDELGVH